MGEKNDPSCGWIKGFLAECIQLNMCVELISGVYFPALSSSSLSISPCIPQQLNCIMPKHAGVSRAAWKVFNFWVTKT